MRKLILSLVFVLGMVTITIANTDSNLIDQVEIENTISSIENAISPIENTISPVGCFSMGAQIFFFLVDNGYAPNQANDIATALETLCNILT